MPLSLLGQRPKHLLPASGFPCISAPSPPPCAASQLLNRAWLLAGADLGDRCAADPAVVGNPL